MIVKVVLGLCFISSLVQAQSSSVSLPQPESSSATSSSTSLKSLNPEYKPNEGITDARMKAEGGSLSRYSVKSSLIYMGPGVGNTAGQDRPNPDKVVGTYATSMTGAISGRYRMNSDSALGFGTGLSALHPFNGVDRVDTKVPFVGYDLADRYGAFQLRQNFEASQMTIPEKVATGQYGGLTYSLMTVSDIGFTRFSYGLDTRLAYSLYNRAYLAPVSLRNCRDGNAQTYSLSVNPNLNYNFSDRLVANTSLSYSYQNLRSTSSLTTLRALTLTQSAGFSYSFTRDILVAPFISFYPNQFVSETTTINFAAIVSVL
jgi:hypothetical protein